MFGKIEGDKMNELLLKTISISGNYEPNEILTKKLLENNIITMQKFNALSELSPYLVHSIILSHECVNICEMKKKIENFELTHDLLFYLETYRDKIESDFKKCCPRMVYYDGKIQNELSVFLLKLVEAFKGA